MSSTLIPETGALQQEPTGLGEINSSIKSLNSSLYSAKEQNGVTKRSLDEFSAQTLLDENYAAVKECVKDPKILEAYKSEVDKLTDEYNRKMQTLTEEYSKYEQELEKLEQDINAIDPKVSDVQVKIKDLQSQLGLLDIHMGTCKGKIDHAAEMYRLLLNSVKWGYVTKELVENATQQQSANQDETIAIKAKIYDSIAAFDKFISELDVNRRRAKQERRHRIQGSSVSKTGIGAEMKEQRQLREPRQAKQGEITLDTAVELQSEKRVESVGSGQKSRELRRAECDKFLDEMRAEGERVKKIRGSGVSGGRKLRKKGSPEEPKQNEQHNDYAVKSGDIATAASDTDN